MEGVKSFTSIVKAVFFSILVLGYIFQYFFGVKDPDVQGKITLIHSIVVGISGVIYAIAAYIYYRANKDYSEKQEELIQCRKNNDESNQRLTESHATLTHAIRGHNDEISGLQKIWLDSVESIHKLINGQAEKNNERYEKLIEVEDKIDDTLDAFQDYKKSTDSNFKKIHETLAKHEELINNNAEGIAAIKRQKSKR